jgi:hypothetical protein
VALLVGKASAANESWGISGLDWDLREGNALEGCRSEVLLMAGLLLGWSFQNLRAY